ncbi:MAG: helix-turn-helix domain-containing protein [Candidatus Promineifilaceae bacterium]|jgi:hypothetical protein
MINKTTIWNHIMETMGAFEPFYHDQALGNLRQAQGRRVWLPLLKSAVSPSTPLTVDHLATSAPYLAWHRHRELLDGALERGLLAEEHPGAYRLTQQGKDALAAFFDCAQAAIAGAPVLPQGQMAELAALLERIVLATERLPLPRSKANFESSRWTDPGPNAPAAVRVDQYLTDLLHFRDDAHLSSWQAYGVDGRSWEAFTLIWRDEANTPADLAGNLSRRGYDENDYSEAVHLLQEKGWIEQALGRWQITGNGRALRDVAEMVTDRLFFAPWRALDERELERLNELLVNLTLSLRQSEPVLLPA